MTTIAVNDVGFCADFSPQGDWAFEYALSVAQSAGYGCCSWSERSAAT